MKIFLSWSGNRSRHLATAFKEWLPDVLQYIDPYMSAKDIQLGERWSTNIEDSLRSHDFGLIFVTPENIDAPWINFEAGALTKNLKSRVIPILFEADVSILNNGPLKQFQSQKSLDKESILDLLVNINSAEQENTKLTSERLESSFNKWWIDLDNKIKAIPDDEKINLKDEDDQPFDQKAAKIILKKLDDIERSNYSSQYERRNNTNAVLNDLSFNLDILKQNIMNLEDTVSSNDLAMKILNNISFQTDQLTSITDHLKSETL